MEPVTVAALAAVAYGAYTVTKPEGSGPLYAPPSAGPKKKCSPEQIQAGVQGAIAGAQKGSEAGSQAGPKGAAVGAGVGVAIEAAPLLAACGPEIEKKLREMAARGVKDARAALANLDKQRRMLQGLPTETAKKAVGKTVTTIKSTAKSVAKRLGF